MPQRASREKTVYGGPQGEDAYVTIKKMTLDEGRAFMSRITKAAEDETTNPGGGGEQAARTAYSEIILDWNWVDDGNKPLAKPHNNPDVLGEILGDEFGFIVAVVNGTEEGEKKESTPSSKPSTNTS